MRTGARQNLSFSLVAAEPVGEKQTQQTQTKAAVKPLKVCMWFKIEHKLSHASPGLNPTTFSGECGTVIA